MSIYSLKLNFLAVSLFLGLMVSCQTLEKKADLPVIDSWQKRLAFLQQQDHWRLKGKLGFSYVYQEQTKLVSASLGWQKESTSSDMSLSGPLGMGEFTIEKRPGMTVLTNHKGDQFKAASPEKLFMENTGVFIPWSDLEFWVLGVPVKGKAYGHILSEEDTTVLAELAQSGWQITYLSYKEVDGLPMPAKIRFSRGDLKATIIIRNWELSS